MTIHSLNLESIATFFCDKKTPAEAARQASVDTSAELGEIRFRSGLQFEQALEDIEGFSHLWLIYSFHLHPHQWKPKVLPPRGSEKKVGVFATRSPYRPNSLGLSCVKLVERKGLILRVQSFDLLDQTPILDIKPYLSYSDSFPDASMGWLQGIQEQKLTIQLSTLAETQLQFLEDLGLREFRNVILQQLSFDPLNSQKKRVHQLNSSQAVLSYKTWRVFFKPSLHEQLIQIQEIRSGYNAKELADLQDPYQDRALHLQFLAKFNGPLLVADDEGAK
ncbi:MAG: tRNA (N6-threonylcarbamoyladenosine(37)-N6)-methyltransferase TrmO [Bdellovibrio sp. CG10_big_fil_rev_8_21_14_0_10_47_8]|nr:MAG: tRNA (N6-threonylcarbamoyladenosine(37)-N6)-methyltransferase TrmO [Bdellovibrio sp. CG10_big_fil_rev_8_21_14_0_10_47_8]